MTTHSEHDLDILQHSDLGQDLSALELSRLTAFVSKKSLKKNHQLFHQMSPASQVFLVTEGVLMVDKLSVTGRRQVVAFLFPGDFIGFSYNDFYEYSAAALAESTVLAIPRMDFVTLTDQIATLKRNLGNISNNVLSRALDQVFALGQKNANERVCFLIQQLHERQSPSDSTRVELPMSRQDIADYLGLTIETVSRAIAQLKKAEIITEVTQNSLEIYDRETLTDMARLD